MKQQAKRFFTLLLALAMCLSLAAPAWAAEALEAPDTKGSASGEAVEAAPITAESEGAESPAPIQEGAEAESTEIPVPAEETPAEEIQAEAAPDGASPEGETAPENAQNAANAAEEAPEVRVTASGSCGSSLQWSLSSSTLTISGTGKMDNYNRTSEGSAPPWDNYSGVITEAILLDGVSSIGSYAFSYLGSLNSVKVPSSVTSIGKYAFIGCAALTGIAIPSGVTSISDGTFCFCTRLSSVTIPNGVKSINTAAFGECEGLTQITIPDNVVTISNAAFSGCSRLSSIRIGSGVTTIGAGAFYDCMHLTSVTVPKNVTSIRKGAFYGCTRLKSITLLSSATRIGNYAFGYYGYSDTGMETRKSLSGACLTGYSGSTAETYAQKNGFTFQNCKTGKKVSYPSQVILKSVSNGKGKKLKVSWGKNTSGSGYQLQYSTDKNFKKNVTQKSVKSNKTTSATFSKLKKGKKYYVRIRSYKKISGTTYYSSWSSVKSVKIRK